MKHLKDLKGVLNTLDPSSKVEYKSHIIHITGFGLKLASAMEAPVGEYADCCHMQLERLSH